MVARSLYKKNILFSKNYLVNSCRSHHYTKQAFGCFVYVLVNQYLGDDLYNKIFNFAKKSLHGDIISMRYNNNTYSMFIIKLLLTT